MSTIKPLKKVVKVWTFSPSSSKSRGRGLKVHFHASL
jgi:hypothetical protein